MKAKKEIFVVLVLICFALPCLAEFIDISAGQPAYPAVKKLVANGIITVPANNKFNGNDSLTLYQLAVIMDKLIERAGQLKEIEARPLEDFFVDVPPSHYAYKAVADLVKLGVFTVSGQKRFEGKALVNRYAFYSYYALFLEKITDSALPASATAIYLDLKPDNPSYVFVKKLIAAGLLNGYGIFSGDQTVDRNEMAVFTTKVLDHLSGRVKGAEKKAPAEAAVSEYSDIPEGNYAGPAVNELVGEGILTPGPDRKFYGDYLINQYLLVDFVSRVLEKILVGETGELTTANPALAYKDVPPGNFAYRSVQKLIKLGVIPAGEQRELLYGDRKINRYQMIFFTLAAIERALADVIKFKTAEPTLAYSDVPPDHFAYETVQKLVWLGVLEGGPNNKFNGGEYVNRYELSFFTVNLIKAIFLKLKEIETPAREKPVEYGFKTFLTTQLDASQIVNGKGPGQTLTNASALQTIRLSVERSLGQDVSVYGSLNSTYSFGGNAALSSPVIDNGYVLFKNQPCAVQAGRSTYYQGYTPFGNSLFIDTTSDMILANYDQGLFSLNASVGKLGYVRDVSQDSNFGFASFTPKLPPLFGWLEFTAGGSLITNLPAPITAAPLPTRLTQGYGGVKINLFGLFELTAEHARLNLSNPAVLPIIGVSDEVGD
ncbi:MAG: S-layer homology domain-containing protein, partial [Candidatus Margulisbacteria bacterium]|nr:S-layer homology domain-containing protein [Candidatus Margulisiibacteriota bacterium]